MPMVAAANTIAQASRTNDHEHAEQGEFRRERQRGDDPPQ
jgi:hypothetical protein